MQIDVESPMRAAARIGTHLFQPTFRGQPLECENSDARASENNLKVLLKATLEVLAVNVVEDGHILVVFSTGESYLATGFRVGQPLNHPQTLALARFLEKVFGGEAKAWLPVVSEIHQVGYIGPIVRDDLPGAISPRIFDSESL